MKMPTLKQSLAELDTRLVATSSIHRLPLEILPRIKNLKAKTLAVERATTHACCLAAKQE